MPDSSFLPPLSIPFLTDLHCDALYEHIKGQRDITQRSDKGHLDIPRMKEAGVTGQVFAIWVSPTELKPGEYADFVLKGTDVFDEVCAKAADSVARVRSPDEFRQAVSRGRIAAVLGAEGGHALEGRLENLGRFFERGVRVLTLTWCSSNELGDSGGDKHQPHRGLSKTGRAAVKEMNRLGMIVDVSHAAARTVLDVCEVSSAPVIASHSGVRARRDFNRNLSDEEIKAIARNRGVIGLVFLPYFLREPEAEASIEDVLDCIDHVCQLVGPDHAAFGSDFDGFSGALQGLEDVTRMPALPAGLRARGFPEADIAKVAGLNFLRVWDAVQTAAG
jgi:membrane dipeptidase